MARNTLEAVFGALGAGLTGYGRDVARRREEEQVRLDRERQAERDRLADEVTVAGLLERGFGGEQEQRAQGQQRSRTALQMALQGATAGRGGMAPSMPMPTQVQQLAAQQARPQRTPVNVAGRQLSLLETALERAQRQRAEEMEEASLARDRRMADEMRLIGARGEEDRRTLAARTATTQREDMNERKRRAAAEFLQAAREGVIEQDPNDQYKQRKRALNVQERKQLREYTYAAYGLNPDGSPLAVQMDETQQTVSRAPTGVDATQYETLRAQRDAALQAVDSNPQIDDDTKRLRKANINARFASDVATLRVAR